MKVCKTVKLTPGTEEEMLRKGNWLLISGSAAEKKPRADSLRSTKSSLTEE